MNYNFKDYINKAKEKEAYISFEFYRLLKNAISTGLVYEDSKTEFKEIIPEFPINKERNSLVVIKEPEIHKNPLLIMELLKIW